MFTGPAVPLNTLQCTQSLRVVRGTHHPQVIHYNVHSLYGVRVVRGTHHPQVIHYNVHSLYGWSEAHDTPPTGHTLQCTQSLRVAGGQRHTPPTAQVIHFLDHKNELNQQLLPTNQ